MDTLVIRDIPTSRITDAMGRRTDAAGRWRLTKDALPRGRRRTRRSSTPIDVFPADMALLDLWVHQLPQHIADTGPAADARNALMFLVRTEPERFPRHLVELIQDRRERSVETMGDVRDWDCDACRHAVLTKIPDTGTCGPIGACPNCGA